MVPFSSRVRGRVVLVFTFIAAVLFFLHQGPPGGQDAAAPAVYSPQAFHLLVPATSTNDNFCRLLLSAAVNRYPVPILINWGAKEAKDAYVQHLAKVWTILDYLEVLLTNGKKDDLVLIIDGFDIHFQLPPEVLISRYFQENERANKRIAAQMGAEVAAKNNISQTVIFGHDKLCWPTDWRRPACWLVPEASDPKKSYGPVTDSNPTVSRARWLNSGTILGPVNHVRDIFRATLDLIHTNHTTDSDQFYFANIQATQEHARHLLEPDPYRGVNKNEKNFPVIEAGNRTEYNFGLDYEGVLFQTMAFYREFIAWETFDGIVPKTVSSIWKTTNRNQQIIKRDPYYSKVLPEDVALARPPFSAAGPASAVSNSRLPTNITWRDLSLGTNANSRQIFPLLHFTGPKEFRRKWYPRLWFLPWAEDLLIASVKAPRAPLSDRPIGGKIWWAGETGNETRAQFGEKGGAWSDSGEFLGWDGLCKVYEPIVFGKLNITQLNEMADQEAKQKQEADALKKEAERKEEEKKGGEKKKEEEKKEEEKKEEEKKEEEKKEGPQDVKEGPKEEVKDEAKGEVKEEGKDGEKKEDVKSEVKEDVKSEEKSEVKDEDKKADTTEVKSEPKPDETAKEATEATATSAIKEGPNPTDTTKPDTNNSGDGKDAEGAKDPVDKTKEEGEVTESVKAPETHPPVPPDS